jgi:pimeloyl-ACP methyl ester carboxylesterase
MIAPAFEVAMAKTIKARSITLPSSHVPMLSHPDEVAAFITEAAQALKAR